MTNLHHVLEEIERDAVIDNTRLEFEILRVPQLYSKYLNMYTRESIALRREQGAYDALKKARAHFYLGKAPDEVYQRERNDHKVLKTDLDMYLAADGPLTDKAIELQTQKVLVEAIEKFLNVLRQRGYELKTVVDYIRFKAGA